VGAEEDSDTASHVRGGRLCFAARRRVWRLAQVQQRPYMEWSGEARKAALWDMCGGHEPRDDASVRHLRIASCAGVRGRKQCARHGAPSAARQRHQSRRDTARRPRDLRRQRAGQTRFVPGTRHGL
jgi:hypothetical protein